MGAMKRVALAAATLLAVALTTACGSGAGTDSAPAEPVIDLSKLDTGNFPTQPKVYDKAGNTDLGKAVAAERLANYLPLPSEIIPEAKYAPPAMSGAVRPFIDFGSGAVKLRTTAPGSAFTAAAPGFLSGFVTTANSDPTAGLAYQFENLVLLFTDEQSARAAAPALGQTDLDASPGSQRVGIDGHPDAFAYLDTNLDFNGTIRSWYATGRYVILTYIWDNVMAETGVSDPGKLTDRVKRALDVIPPALAKYQAPTADQLTEQPVDLDGVLGRALPTVSDDQSERGIPGVYDGHGARQLFPGDDDAALFDKAGVDRVAFNGGEVFRARDAAGAAAVVAAHSRISRTYRPADSPQGLPNALCRKYTGPQKFTISYYCFVTHGRFAAEVSANQLLDAQQRISAQYARLVNAHE
ncbi:DUF7373 family lipoprotein [Nocardia sp. NPDC004722]